MSAYNGPKDARNRAIYKTKPKEQKKTGRPRTREAKPDLLTQVLGTDHAQEIEAHKAEQRAEREAQEAANTGAAPAVDMKPLANRAKKARENSPVANRFKNVTQQDNAETTAKVLELYNLDPIDTTDINQIGNRVQYYFNWCASGGIRPGVEGLALALGTTRSTLNRWEHGENGADKRDIIKKAKQFIANYLEILAQSGKINPVTYIFMAKNNHGYKDQTDININIDNPLGDQVNPDTIAQRLPDVNTDSNIIDGDFREL